MKKKQIPTSSGDLISVYMETENYLNAETDIEDIAQHLRFPIISPHFRIFVLNPDESVKFEIPQQDIVHGGSYSENYQSGARRSLSFSLFNDDGKYTPSPDTLWANTKLSFDMGIEIDEDILWFKKGVFLITTIAPSHEAERKTMSVQTTDKFGLLESASGSLETTYEIPEGIEIEKVIKDLLLMDKGDGGVFDSKPIIYHHTFKGLKTPIATLKQEGDTIGSIILELAIQLSAEVFYNSEGNLNIIPVEEVSSDIDKPVIFDFFDVQGDFTSLDFSFDLAQVVNKIVVIGSTMSGGAFSHFELNENPASPLSVSKIGYRTAVINDSNIYSDYLAEERARYELRKVSVLQTTSTLPTTFNPLLFVNNLVTITDEFFDLSKEKFLLQGVEVSLEDGSTSAQVSNINNLPFTTKSKRGQKV